MKGLTCIRLRPSTTFLIRLFLCGSISIFFNPTASVTTLVPPLPATTLGSLLPCNWTKLSPAEQLSCLIYQRERLMKDVAAHKYLNNNPLFDASQELRVLRKAIQNSHHHQLPAVEVTLYAQILMDISKQIQAYYWIQWQQQQLPPPLAAPSIHQIRQQIGMIDAKIIDQFKQIRQQCSLSSQQELEDATSKWLAQLPGIQPEWNKQLFSELLTTLIYPIVHPNECPS